MAALAPEVRDYDPIGALDGGTDGLSAYRRIGPRLRKALRPGGFALFEVGPDQARAVLCLLAEAGLDAGGGQRLWCDLAGRARVVGGQAVG
jgi:release factor glutamine methyltransferase